jgi:hypothetical protein
MTNRALALTTCLAALGISGCLHPKIGPRSLPRDRAEYSLSLSDSWKEQTLLNIVKFRYVDPPVFVDVGSIVASYSLSQNASVGGTFQTTGPNGASVGGGVGLTSNPTITYTPLTGSAYIKSLVTPLSPLTVFAAIQNGSPADVILLSSVLSINGIRNQRVSIEGIKPADPEFHRVRQLLRDIQDSGAVRLYAKVDPQKEQIDIVSLRTDNIPPDVQAEIVELRRLLHLNLNSTEFKLVSAPLPSSDTELAIQTRSIEELLVTLSAQVEVPPEDVDRHRAFPGFASGREVPNVVPMIRVHSSKKKPDDSFVKILYRNTWFWIDDGDLASKRAFAQLMQLFTMADTSPRADQPVLTIPTR